MHAPMACIFGFPAPTSRSKNPLRTGLNRTAVCVGRNSAWRSRAFPAFDRRVRLRTLVPERNARGASPQAAAEAAPSRRRLQVHVFRWPRGELRADFA
jgi:hypothetical protein